jgi:hypothetical protein
MDVRNKKNQIKADRTAIAALVKLLNFRNDRGHDLSGINSQQALSFLRNNQIVETFLTAMTSADCVLRGSRHAKGMHLGGQKGCTWAGSIAT